MVTLIYITHKSQYSTHYNIYNIVEVYVYSILILNLKIFNLRIFLVSVYKIKFQRRFIIFWFFGGLIISLSYCGVLFEQMTQLSPPPLITSLKQLAYSAKIGDFKPFVPKSVSYSHILEVFR